MGIGENVAVKADRARAIFELRLAGHSFAAIADTLNTSESTVYYDMTKWINKLLTPRAAEARTLEVERLNRLLLALDPKVRAGDINAIRTAAGISGQISKLLGLEMPQQVEHKVRVVDAVDDEIMRAMSEFEAAAVQP